ncbi:Uncharacterized protein conserved in bacteria [Sebaldella termitidis]|uniref:DUF2213 domain-containing protein n=1 Tax=Sebaldella termitidis (strain ATCC 33386 / NCTC 11300) TaxID=526218 RepID=D1AN78_SEBTE|nr:DUF2213 domain-containing protein [Sebaldella termitidis]ACZ09682.1 conserved hypothetical protein [Sebaldella termitidis ATCC 33386]SUI25014.1 Uncharacterized protein conserved in bacteria [Sebaldella termitidis]
MIRFNLGEMTHFEVTEEGFLRIKGYMLEADKYMDYYLESNQRIKEKINYQNLFNYNTVKSFEYKTVTLEHPEENGLLTMITNENVSKHKKGTIISVFEEDNKLGAILQVESKDAIDFINQKRASGEDIQLSAGYYANIVQINKDEYIQTNIVGNHVALLSGNGRAGTDIKLIYNYKEDGGNTMKFKWNGKEVDENTIYQEAVRLNQENEKNIKDLKDKTKEFNELKEDYDALLSERNDEEIKLKAQEVLNSEEYEKAKDDTKELMKAVIMNVNPTFNESEDIDEDQLIGVFNFCYESSENSKPDKKTKLNNDGKSEDTTERKKFNSGYFKKFRSKSKEEK